MSAGLHGRQAALLHIDSATFAVQGAFYALQVGLSTLQANMTCIT